MIFKTLHRKLNIEQDKPTRNLDWTQMLRKGWQFLLQSFILLSIPYQSEIHHHIFGNSAVASSMG